MNKKSILPIILAFVLSLSSLTGFAAKKDSGSDAAVQTEEKKSLEKADGNDDSEKSDKEDTKEDNKEDKKEDDKEDEEDDIFSSLHAESCLLADLDSAKVLYSENGDKKVYPASTTKILTAILVLERCNLADSVTATDEAVSPITMKHSNMGIRVGEKFTVEQLLYGMLVASANDAANVLAVHTAGSLENFASLMNAKARSLGAENSNFVNAHGFHDDDHYTTANDLAKISCYAMKNEKFAEMVKTAKYQIPATEKYPETRYLANTNMLISANKGSGHIYKKAIGIKTGSTDEAGNCLVSAAESGGTRLLCIVMGCKNEGVGDRAYSYTDTKALLEYGFENYTHMSVAHTSDIIESSAVREAKGGKRVSLSPEEEISVLLPKDADLTKLETEIEVNPHIKAPIGKGDILGTVSYSLDGEELGTTRLVAANDVERDLFLHIVFTLWDIFSDPIVLCSALLIIILILYARSAGRRKRREKRRRRRFEEFENFDD